MPEKLSRLSVIETALAGLIQRVGAIESLLGPPIDEAVDAGCDGDRRLSKKQLAQRWGRSPRTIDRMRRVADFPAPDIINGQLTWWLSIVQVYERATQAGGTAPDRSKYLARSKASTEAAAKEVAGKEASAAS